MLKYCAALFIFISVLSCNDTTGVDLVIYNARIYTVDSSFRVAEAMAIKGGRIEAVGTTKDIQAKYSAGSNIDVAGKPVYPGFIDAHAHFYRYGLGLQTADLVGTTSWDEIISKLDSFGKAHREGWLIGRGWDQNDWDTKEFPSKEKLDAQYPNRPVLLTRVDGHAAIVNQKALDIAGIQPGMKLTGGTVETAGGKLTGLLIDNAVDLVAAKIPAETPAQVGSALKAAQQACFAVGLTTVDDCGLDFREVLRIDSFQKSGALKMRVYAMLSDTKANYDFLFGRGAIKTDRLNVRAFKVYADGALGSRGACLLHPYTDRAGWTGFLLNSLQHYDSVARIISSKGFQMCTHAIGDSANRAILNVYGKYLQPGNDLRWRIEHAQVVNEADFSLFGKYSVVPSVQPTHATSDMYWAGARLGPEREQGAYAFQRLLKQNGWIPLGTDFPVEDISPFKTFLAAVFRQDAKGFPNGGYMIEEGLTRMDAIRGMTIWAARSNFEEGEKGSLERGKLADFIILDRDLMQIKSEEVLQTGVLGTYIGGEKVYGK